VASSHPLTASPIQFQPLTVNQVEEAVRLHRASLDYSINSRLGPGHLSYLYAALLQDETCLVVAAVGEGKVLGVVSAVLDPDLLKKRLFASMPLRHWIALAGRAAFQPKIWLEWLRNRQLDQPVRYKGQLIKPCLTAIAVQPSTRRAGLGRALVEAVDGFVRQHSHPFYHLDTRANNQAARSFYRHLGFVELEQRGRDVIFVRKL
jgi:ribosomal protein S18 acetylase RimI-like enzyme